MRKLLNLLANLERNSLFRPANSRIIARGQNPLGEPSLVRVYPSLRPKRARKVKLKLNLRLKRPQDRNTGKNA